MEGGCACGAIRYRLRAAPMFVHCCHCRDCQRQTGSAFVLNALIETGEVELLGGRPAPVSMPTESGRPHDVYRCPDCGTALWSDYGRRRVMLFVRVGTLDDPTALRPDMHIFTRSKLPWVVLPEGAPAVPVYYDMESLWPAASLARRRAILGNEG
ncbi:MAG TPA: GFA family protein [Acetobacteraceae bacterium]|nr:GFA family protein [Acetobacteraceae bacterium]